MTETTKFEIRASANCTDGPCGQVRCVVVDPVAQEVTHLVIGARHREGLGRLVPLGLIQEGHLWGRKEVALPIGAVTGLGDVIQLNIGKSEVRDLPAIDVEHPNE